MKIAIMQPYFFPYIGYFQLINAVDTFVIYDDVNYIRRGWVNRNYILINGEKKFLILETKNASIRYPINRVQVGENKDKVLKTILYSYRRAPYFTRVFPIIENIFSYPDGIISNFLGNSLKIIASYLDIRTEFIYSSNIEKNNVLRGQDKIIQICKISESKTYINSIGGTSLYNKEDFLKNNIELKFIQTKEIVYKQFNNEFIPWLSIIDVMMFNSKEEIRKMLNSFELI